MTQLYKKNGAVFIHAGITIEEVERIEKENEWLKAFESHCDEIEEDAKFIAKENAELKIQLETEKKLNAYIKARFVECNTCTSEKKEKCLMWSEKLCEGERCNELVDLEQLINKAQGRDDYESY